MQDGEVEERRKKKKGRLRLEMRENGDGQQRSAVKVNRVICINVKFSCVCSFMHWTRSLVGLSLFRDDFVVSF